MKFRIPAVTVLGLALAATMALASSHSEAPGTAKDRLADDTDVYAWVSPDAPNAVTFVGNWVPLIEPNSGPNFAAWDDQVTYWFNIDNVGDAQDHIRYAFTFTNTRQNGNTFLYNTGVVSSLDDPDLNVRQTYTITRYDNGTPTVLASGLPVAPAYVGPKSMPDYASLAQAAVRTLSDGSKVFVGPRDDPFFVDLAGTFDLLTIRKPPGNQGGGIDGLGGFDVLTIAMQVPKVRLTKDGQPAGADNSVIGVYVSSDRYASTTLNGDGTTTTSGGLVQVSRLGNPLVNEVVVPLKDKDKFNATKPYNDGVFLPYVVDPELAHLLTALYGIATPPAPRNDLVAIFLTGIPGLNQPTGTQTPCEMLRLNMSTPPAAAGAGSRYGVLGGDVAGYPNGRRLADDVVDIAERAVAGATPFTAAFNVAPNNQLGDGVDANDVPFLPYFPYVAPPQNPFDHTHHATVGDGDDGGSGHGKHKGWDLGKGNPHRAQGTDAAQAASSRVSFGMSLAGANPSTTSRMQFALPTAGRVALRIYDVNGRVVRTLLDRDAAAGEFVAQWDGTADSGARAGAGVYFARLVSGAQTAERKIVLQ